MEVPKLFDSEIIAVGDIVPDDFIPPVDFPNALTQLRNNLREYNFVLNSKPLDKSKRIFFESYIRKERESKGSHDQYDALIHKHRYCLDFTSQLSINLLGKDFPILHRTIFFP